MIRASTSSVWSHTDLFPIITPLSEQEKYWVLNIIVTFVMAHDSG